MFRDDFLTWLYSMFAVSHPIQWVFAWMGMGVNVRQRYQCI